MLDVWASKAWKHTRLQSERRRKRRRTRQGGGEESEGRRVEGCIEQGYISKRGGGVPFHPQLPLLIHIFLHTSWGEGVSRFYLHARSHLSEILPHAEGWDSRFLYHDGLSLFGDQ